MSAILLHMKNISKEFPGVKALENVDLIIKKGSVHALMGENGAGKSTLMKVLIGMYQSYTGEIIFKGKPLQVKSIHETLQNGISMIHQELSPIPCLSVAENIFLNREPLRYGFIHESKRISDTKALFSRIGIKDIKPEAKMKDLSVAQTQMIEIAKAVSYNSDLIIMDEPTSAITDSEVDQLFKIIREVCRNGVSVVFITHKIDEVFKIVDEITVLRDGRNVKTVSINDTSKQHLVEMMVGRELNQLFPKEEVEIGEELLRVSGLSRKGLFHDVSFSLRKGEILGVAGLMGAGRSEVAECIFGVKAKDSGEIFMNGKPLMVRSTRDAIKAGIAFLTEDRKQSGIFPPLSVLDNIIVSSIDLFKKLIFIDRGKTEQACDESIKSLSIKTPSKKQLIMNLSGGNQQKVLISRWLMTDPEVLILDEPTRGIDVGAKSEIHRLMTGMVKAGKGVLMISSELPEIMGMCDRIIVMHEGEVTGVLDRKDFTQKRIMQLATKTTTLEG